MAMASHDIKDANVMGDINVTPMVDVMLVLLIIFMVVTPAIAAGFQAKLPQGAHLKQRDVQEENRTVLGIDQEGSFYLNKKAVPGCAASQRTTTAGKAACDQVLLNLLTQEYQKHPDDRVLFLRADQRLKYQVVLDAMDLAKRGGARMVAQVSEQRPGTSSKDLETAVD